MNARNLLVHAVVMVVVALFLCLVKTETIVRGAFLLSALWAGGMAILSIVAVPQLPFFRFHYPFTNPTQIAFPFPTYNMASDFVLIACLGLAGAGSALRKPIAVLLGVPVFLLASALTGSRSGMLVLIVMLVVLGITVMWRAVSNSAFDLVVVPLSPQSSLVSLRLFSSSGTTGSP